MIRVRMTTTKGELQAMAVAAVSDMRRNAIRILHRVGQKAVNMARDKARKNGTDWTDDTGNLRSSIGYIICEDGKPIEEGKFDRVDGPNRSKTTVDGTEVGKEYAYSLAGDTKGLALIVVAGMDYAVYVAGRGYDVLSSSQILAQNLIPKLFEMQARHDKKNG